MSETAAEVFAPVVFTKDARGGTPLRSDCGRVHSISAFPIGLLPCEEFFLEFFEKSFGLLRAFDLASGAVAKLAAPGAEFRGQSHLAKVTAIVLHFHSELTMDCGPRNKKNLITTPRLRSSAELCPVVYRAV